LSKYVSGEISEQTVRSAFLKIIKDPENFFRFWFEYGNRPNPFAGEFSGVTSSVDKFIVFLQDNYEKYEENSRVIRKLKRDYHNELRDLKIVAPESVEAHRIPDIENEKPLAINELLAKIIDEGQPNIDPLVRETMLPFFMSYFGQRKLKKSDSMDLLHSLYIPNVDLWRGDRAYSEVLLKANHSQRSKIVQTREELPQRISQLLESAYVRNPSQT
jgi:hypothetical protein